ncbi:MAG TPA: DUF3943 domain-containing protein, partial [Kiritimatiellia bacterium]|nr:DUF3943 domain-containing protein [Kiritimatiellia bacterium]
RTNGMSFGWSAAGALGGSLMWELFMETEPPSINDVLATTAGGIALGEITFRISSSLVNNHARGLERVTGEADDLAYVSFAGNTDRNVLAPVMAKRGKGVTMPLLLALCPQA